MRAVWAICACIGGASHGLVEPGRAVRGGLRLRAERGVCDGEEFSALARSLSPSKTIEVHGLTQRMLAAGEEVISLSVGEPDFAPFPEIVRATAAAAREGETRYTEVAGSGALREAISRDLSRRKQTSYAASEIVVTNGAKQAVYQAILALCGPGDEVIVPAPYWVSYPEIVKLSGATAVVAETRLEDGYKLTAASLRKALTARTKALVLCNPCNPTGACLDEAELRALHAELRGTDVWVVADEIYERLHYDPDRPHVSFAALDADAFARTAVVNGFSKAFAMTGFRLGYLAAPRPLAAMAAKLQGQLTSCASSLSQAAGIAALDRVPDAALRPLVDEFKARRDFVLTRLREMGPRVACPPDPDGAFYVLPDVAACFRLAPPLEDDDAGGSSSDGLPLGDSSAFCAALLRHRKLALVPGDAFGAPRAVRISYATDRATLASAMDALEAFVQLDLRDPSPPRSAATDAAIPDASSPPLSSLTG
mmetsp:Transcript_3781/g.11596  ORF Transcript_3781/g.11596 Transcript_3781/m.11596 type:complete len:482 (-) Transcript_3781:111-1556(-)